jgi:hypothetical protein
MAALKKKCESCERPTTEQAITSNFLEQKIQRDARLRRACMVPGERLDPNNQHNSLT